MTTPDSTRSSRWLGRRYLFHVGQFGMPSYAALLYLGFALGVVCAGYVCRLGYLRFTACALVLLLAALIGSRLWYFVGHPKFLTSHKDGAADTAGDAAGAGLYGGLVLSFAVSWPLVRLAGFDFWRFWDGVGIVMLVGMVITRFGCLMNGCCAGRETQGPLGMWLPDYRGQWKRRYPTQLFEAGWSATILVVALLLYRPSEPPGLLFLGAAAAYAIGRLVLEQLRAEAVSYRFPSRVNASFSVLLAVASIAGFVLKLR